MRFLNRYCHSMDNYCRGKQAFIIFRNIYGVFRCTTSDYMMGTRTVLFFFHYFLYFIRAFSKHCDVDQVNVVPCLKYEIVRVAFLFACNFVPALEWRGVNT